MASWILACLMLLLTEPSTGQNTLPAIFTNECEETVASGETIFRACGSEEVLNLVGGAVVNVEVTPPEATCGQTGPEDFCTLDDLQPECDVCNERVATKRHPPDFVVDADGNTTWWQSVTWSNYPDNLEINVTLSYGKQFELRDDVIITFNSGRPQEMALLKSKDNGKTWEPLQYYSQRNCQKYFRDQRARPFVTRSSLAAVICTDEYSGSMPMSGGQVVLPISERLRLAQSGGSENQLYLELGRNQEFQDFLVFTDLRIQLLHPATDGREIFGSQQSFLKYYYAISNINITGRCFCNLHGKCEEVNRGQHECTCSHQTTGVDCEVCRPLYNQRPWVQGSYLPLRAGEANQCLLCDCNNHSAVCEYNSTMRTGVCINCTDNTMSTNCDKCMPGFYRNESLQLNDTNICIECDCEPLGTLDPNATCLAESDSATGQMSGQCLCQVGITGQKCDECAGGFYGLLVEPDIGTCKPCECNTRGTVGANNACEQTSGQCFCKMGITALKCDKCKDGYHTFPQRFGSDCESCGCNLGAALVTTCEEQIGQCECRPNIQGLRCDQTASSHFIPAYDSFLYKPFEFSECTNATALRRQQYFSDIYYIECGANTFLTFMTVSGLPQPALEWLYQVGLRYSYNGTTKWDGISFGTVVLGDAEEVNVPGSDQGPFRCRDSDRNHPSLSFSLAPGQGKSHFVTKPQEPLMLDARCLYQFTLQFSVAPPNENPNITVIIDSLVLFPDPKNLTVYARADRAQVMIYDDCIEKLGSAATRQEAMEDTACRKLFFSLGAEIHNGSQPCECNTTGTLAFANPVCDMVGGACSCKRGVEGRQCDRCQPGYYGFSSEGCKPCQCRPTGSETLVCDYDTGQCPCKPGVATARLNNSLDFMNDLRCSACIRGYFGYNTGNGCEQCLCSTEGSMSVQCTENGCVCKPTIDGVHCDRCMDGYFSFSSSGCLPCNCSMIGSVNETCDTFSGECYCKPNVEGLKCDSCPPGTFNLNPLNPNGCQSCFCFGHAFECESASGYFPETIDTVSTNDWDVAFVDGLAYFSAPFRYLGNNLYSYLQNIMFDMMSTVRRVTVNGTRVLIFQGHNTSAWHSLNAIEISNVRPTRVSIFLHEHNFQTSDTRQPTSFEFQRLLASMTNLYIIKDLLQDEAQINNVVLETVVFSNKTLFDEFSDPIPMLTSVENCSCQVQNNVEGHSCTACQEGYMRVITNGTQFDTCIQCDCSGNSMTEPLPDCNPYTGECLNCRNGTTGSKCELCAANVQPPDCSVCERGFYGLSQDGCKPCNCDTVGSLDIACDMDTGQCTCQLNVGGLKCDRCQLNFMNFGPSGCVECEECYSNLLTEVQLLQEQRDNLTSLIAMIRNQSMFSDLPRFRTRLRSITNHVQDLVNNVRNAELVNEDVHNNVKNLNESLAELVHIIDSMVAPVANATNHTLLELEGFMHNNDICIADTNSTLYQVFLLLRGSIFQLDTEIQSLVNELHAQEITVLRTAGNIIEAISSLENMTSSMTNQTAEAVRLIAQAEELLQDANIMQEQNSMLLTELSTLVDTIRDLTESLNTSVTKVKEDTGKIVDQFSDLLSVAGDITVSTDFAFGLASRAASLIRQANHLIDRAIAQQESNEAFAFTINTQLTETERIRSIVQQTHSLASEVSERGERMYERAVLAVQLASSAFKNATNMLDILVNFEDRSEEFGNLVEEELENLGDLNDMSRAAIDQSENLQRDVASAVQSTKLAADLAEEVVNQTMAESREIIQTRQQAEMAFSESRQLTIELRQEREIKNINVEQVQPLKRRCENIEPRVNSIEQRVITTSTETNEAFIAAKAADTKVKELVQRLKNLPKLDNEELVQLENDLRDTDSLLSQQDIRSAMEVLLKAREEQKRFISHMMDRAAKAKAQIDALKLLRSRSLG